MGDVINALGSFSLPSQLGTFCLSTLDLTVPRRLPQLQTSCPHTTVLEIRSRRQPEPKRDLLT